MPVYCIADTAKTVLKVGFTKDKESAASRMKTLQTSCPYRLQLLAFCPQMTLRDEKYIHDLIKEYRLDGGTEWFSFDAIAIVSGYMKFDPDAIEAEQPKQAGVAKVGIQVVPKQKSKTWADLGITKGKKPYYIDDDKDDDDDTDFCPVLEKCITEYAKYHGIDPECLSWPDSDFGEFPNMYLKFLPYGYKPITCSELAKRLIAMTEGEYWHPSQVMAKVIANAICSAQCFPGSPENDDEIQVYPVFNDHRPGHLLMVCFAEPRECIDYAELLIDDFFWDLDAYEMNMSFLIIDGMHNYYEVTYSHPMTQLNREEVNRLRLGELARI